MSHHLPWTSVLALALCLTAVGCDDDKKPSVDPPTDAATPDAGDMGDAGTADRAVPSPADLGGPDGDDVDATADDAADPDEGAPMEGEPDAAPDAGPDAQPDAMPDAAPGPPPDPPLPQPDPLAGCFWLAPAEGDEPPRARYEHTDALWPIDHCRGTANQAMVQDAPSLTTVLYLGDASLLRVPPATPDGIPIIGDISELATIRGRLTRRFARRFDLVPPSHDIEMDKTWYSAGVDGVVPFHHQEAFSVCAHDKAGWRDLHRAATGGGEDADPAKLTRRCLTDLPPRIDGRLLIIISLGDYGPDDLDEDERAFGVQGEPAAGADEPLAEVVTTTIDALRALFEAEGFGDVVIIVGNLPAWRAGAIAGRSACDVAANEAWFTRRLAQINTALVEYSRAHRYDVALIDEHVRARATACLDEVRVEAVECQDAGRQPEIASAEPLPSVDDDPCCWVEAPHCDQPDTNGHLGHAAIFEEVAASVLPSR